MKTLLDTEAVLQVGHDSLVVTIYRGAPAAQDIEHVWQQLRGVHSQHDSLTSIFVFTERLAMHFPDDAREVGGEMLRDMGELWLGNASVIATTGLKAAFFRSLLSTMQLMARTIRQKQSQLFRSIDEALDWACELPEQVATVTNARAGLKIELRELIDGTLAGE